MVGRLDTSAEQLTPYLGQGEESSALPECQEPFIHPVTLSKQLHQCMKLRGTPYLLRT